MKNSLYIALSQRNVITIRPTDYHTVFQLKSKLNLNNSEYARVYMLYCPDYCVLPSQVMSNIVIVIVYKKRREEITRLLSKNIVSTTQSDPVRTYLI